MYDARVKAVVV
jgi:hypothetical protein